ncbi:hypothetical protein MSAN_02323300 [Mycena sanguinolenta]|uniref:Uncharacterized protein n=1 Tax=Mycena sanguinolenta TaxID=230812 RepID=A0A8H6X7A5_9AGAR|nr:hypothetical protein MSAN_02323300 [Mycena sanguinolenta]
MNRAQSVAASSANASDELTARLAQLVRDAVAAGRAESEEAAQSLRAEVVRLNAECERQRGEIAELRGELEAQGEAKETLKSREEAVQVREEQVKRREERAREKEERIKDEKHSMRTQKGHLTRSRNRLEDDQREARAVIADMERSFENLRDKFSALGEDEGEGSASYPSRKRRNRER